jgi:hypothetical protein
MRTDADAPSPDYPSNALFMTIVPYAALQTMAAVTQEQHALRQAQVAAERGTFVAPKRLGSGNWGLDDGTSTYTVPANENPGR